MKEIPAELPQKEIRGCVKTHLKAKGMTYKDLADRMLLSERTVTNYLSTVRMSARTVKKISEALDYPFELLIRGEQYYGPDILARWEEKFQQLHSYCKGLERRIKKLEQAGS